MQNQPTKPKVALKAVTPGHLVLSVIVAALTAAGDSAFQYVQTNGLQHFSTTQLIGAMLFSFFGALGTGVVTLEKNPTIEQAIDGAIQPHITALSQIVTQHANLASELTNALVWLNNQVQAQQQSAPAATPAQPQVQQVPFPQQVQPALLRNPQQIPVVNLANPTPAQDNTPVRHWGDTGIVPTVQ